MTSWALSFGWNWVLVPVAIWFVNGLRKALLNPRVKYCSHTSAGHLGKLVIVRRQELLPPWRTLDETWLIDDRKAVRDGDGWTVFPAGQFDAFIFPSEQVFHRLQGLLRIISARDVETEELSK